MRFLFAAAAMAAAVGAAAEESGTRLRGTVEARDADTLTIRQREGGAAKVAMNPKTQIDIATKGLLRDIKPESYLSIVAVPGDDGAARPIRVAIYSPSERGFEAGTRPWDGLPGATLTAGWVGALSPGTPRRVELTFFGGRRVFTIPPDAATTQIAPGEKTLLVPGAEVVAFVRPDRQGLLHADLLVVGRQGAVPGL